MTASEPSVNDLIHRWCERHLATGCSAVPQERLDELQDHLLCVAESRIELGDTPADAANFAFEQFGDPTEVRRQLAAPATSFRRWLAGVHCRRGRAPEGSGSKVIMMSLCIAALLLMSAWLARDDRVYALLSTALIGVWVVLAARLGGTRDAARAEWRWLRRKFGQ